MQKQAGTLQGLGYVEQNAGEVTQHAAEQTYSLNFRAVVALSLSEWISLQNRSSASGRLFHTRV